MKTRADIVQAALKRLLSENLDPITNKQIAAECPLRAHQIKAVGNAKYVLPGPGVTFHYGEGVWTPVAVK